MPRVKRGVTARARHKKVLVLAKGYRGRRTNVYRVANMPTATAASANASSANCGLPVSTPVPASTACLTANS